MNLIRVTSIMLIVSGMLILALGLVHSWAGLDFFGEETRTTLDQWWTLFVVMFFGAGFGLMLAGGILIHAGTVFRRLRGAALIPAALAALFLMFISTLVIFAMPADVITWIIAGLTLVVIVALVFGFAAVRAIQRRKERSLARAAKAADDDTI